MSKEYPVEIYPKPNERIKDSAERIYDLGFRDGRFKERLEASNPLAGWSNLTYAIQAGERIDWEKLDGVEAKCVHPEMGTLTYKLERDAEYPAEEYTGWVTGVCGLVWDEAFCDSWYGRDDWALYIKGDIPLGKQTADQLEPGICFRARYEKNGETHNYAWAQLLKPSGQKPRIIFLSQALTTLFGSALPEDVEVVEVYGVGTFKTPKENQ